MDDKNTQDIVNGYEIKRSILFENNRGVALAENPNAVQPFVTWMFTEDENGNRDYEWGHYTTDGDKAAQDYVTRFTEYIKDFGVSEKNANRIYHKINEDSARRAKEANSFRDYVSGSATAEYRAMVDEARELAERQKQRTDPMYHDKIDSLVSKYAKKLADNINERNVIDARVPSVMISGGGNFPVRQKEKQNAARDRNMGEYTDIKGYLDKIRSTGMGGISADDALAVPKLEAKLADMKAEQEQMKAVNAYYRKHKTLDGCPGLSEEVLGELKASMSRDFRRNPVPFPSYALSNNNQNMHRIEQRIADLKNRSEFVGWSFEGGHAKANEAENRLQLLFDEKPSDEQRQALKKNGFKWSPKQGAWQRQLTKNAIHAAGYIDFIKPTDGKTPYQLQPFSHKAVEDKGDR